MANRSFQNHLDPILPSWNLLLSHSLQHLNTNMLHSLDMHPHTLVHTSRTIVWLRHWRARVEESLVCLSNVLCVHRSMQSRASRRPRRLIGSLVLHCPKGSSKRTISKAPKTLHPSSSRFGFLRLWLWPDIDWVDLANDILNPLL